MKYIKKELTTDKISKAFKQAKLYYDIASLAARGDTYEEIGTQCGGISRQRVEAILKRLYIGEINREISEQNSLEVC